MKAVIFDYNRTLFDPDSNQLFPGVIGLLGRLKAKLKLALVAKGDDSRRNQIQELGIEEYFDVIIVNQSKSTDDYKNCMEKMGVNPAEAYVVGDRVYEEIKMGNSLGAVTVWLKAGKFRDEPPRSPEEQPKFIISDLDELLKLF